MSQRVLVLDTTPGAGLAVVRSLGAAGVDIDVARIGGHSAAEHSRFCRRWFDLGDATVDVHGVARGLIDAVTRDRYDLLIPITDAASEVCALVRETLESRVALAMPPPAAHEYAHDKARVLELGATLDIPVPEHVTLRGFDDLARAREIDLGWPCFVKPIHSVLVTGDRLIRFQVTRVSTRGELLDVERFHLGRVPIMVQRRCPGVGVGIHLLAWEGRIVSLVQQRRLHEPFHGGGGSYRTTEPLDPLLAACADRFVAATGWSGVAMLEFKKDLESNRTWLMEVNGRFWGSLPLTISAGLDFPLWLLRLHLEGPGALPSPLPEPRLDVRQRHLRHDVVWAARSVLRARDPLGTFRDWARDFRRDEHWDTERRDDPMPALAEWCQDAFRLFAPVRRRVRRLAARLAHTVRGRRRALRAIERTTGRSPRVLFVCAGNVCRSPFAERYMRERFAYANVRSAGTLPSANRLVPAAVEEVARERFGVDLAAHRSATLSPAALEWADVIVAMDYINLAELHAHRASAPAILLGDLDRGRVVRDPYGRDAATIERTFGAIASLLDRLHERLVGASRSSMILHE